MRIIDARIRPATESFLESTIGLAKIAPRLKDYWKWFGFESAGESVEKRDVALTVKEMDESGVNMGVITCRWGVNQDQPEPDNSPEEAIEISGKYPGRFVVVIPASVNKVDRALADTEKYIINGPARGINLEFVSDSPYYPLVSDTRFWPLYEFLQEKDIVLYVTGGGLGGSQPIEEIGKVLTAFPHLKIIDAHAHVPDAIQACFMAFRHENYFLLPDLYVPNTFFDRIYYDAAKSMLQDQIIFGTAYPFMPIKETTEYYLKNWDLPDKIREKIMGGTIAKLMDL